MVVFDNAQNIKSNIQTLKKKFPLGNCMLEYATRVIFLFPGFRKRGQEND